MRIYEEEELYHPFSKNKGAVPLFSQMQKFGFDISIVQYTYELSYPQYNRSQLYHQYEYFVLTIFQGTEPR